MADVTILCAELRGTEVYYRAAWVLDSGETVETPPGSWQCIGSTTTDSATLKAMSSGDWLAAVELDAARCASELQAARATDDGAPVSLIVSPSRVARGVAVLVEAPAVDSPVVVADGTTQAIPPAE